jgi:cytochrome P450
MTTLVSYEPLVEQTLEFFLSQTEKIFESQNKQCNLTQWLHFFAFDVIGELTWSKRLGFVEKNEDIDGIIGTLDKYLDYAGPVCFTPERAWRSADYISLQVGQMPILDYILNKNVFHMQLQRWGISKTVFPITKFALARAAEREKRLEGEEQETVHVDLLSKFVQAQKEHPDFMTDDRVLTTCLSMIVAGSETTAVSLGAIFYYLLKNPRTYENLMLELDEATKTGLLEDREDFIVSWKASQQLPYLDAVIQEAFRMHPAAGVMLERVAPSQGIDILNERIPGRTIVGCNAWVLHRCPDVFGEDVDMYRPERWIEASPEKLKEMKATMFQFGAGSRSCLGKNISFLEIYKLIPSFLRKFKVSFSYLALLLPRHGTKR